MRVSASGTVTTIGLVTYRAPQWDGKGDQRRAAEIRDSLGDMGEVVVVVHRAPGRTVALARFAHHLLGNPGLPLQVAWVRSSRPLDLDRQLEACDVCVFVTGRVVPDILPQRSVVDFIDSLGLAASRRAVLSRGPARLFWTLEARRMRRWESGIARRASRAVAVSSVDAEAIHPAVSVIPLALRPSPPVSPTLVRDRVVFTGILRFGPNTVAANWVCDALVPALARRGISPARVLIAGRKPPKSVRDHARRAGVELRADVPSVADVLGEAAVALAPISLATGMQSKVLEAVAARVPVVMTPLAAEGLSLRDGRSAYIRDLEADPIAEAVVALLSDGELRSRLAEQALIDCRHLHPHRVGTKWQALVDHALSTVA